jgi:hypothetical protein
MCTYANIQKKERERAKKEVEFAAGARSTYKTPLATDTHFRRGIKKALGWWRRRCTVMVKIEVGPDDDDGGGSGRKVTQIPLWLVSAADWNQRVAFAK